MLIFLELLASIALSLWIGPKVLRALQARLLRIPVPVGHTDALAEGLGVEALSVASVGGIPMTLTESIESDLSGAQLYPTGVSAVEAERTAMLWDDEEEDRERDLRELVSNYRLFRTWEARGKAASASPVTLQFAT